MHLGVLYSLYHITVVSVLYYDLDPRSSISYILLVEVVVYVVCRQSRGAILATPLLRLR